MVVTARAAVLAVAALLLAGVGVGAALTRDGDEKAAPSVDETTTTSTSTTVLAPTSTVTATSTPATTAVAPTTTVGRTTTTARRATTTTRPATTTTAASGAACTPAQIQAAVTTSKPYYAPGEVVEATSTLRNRSTAPCTYNGYAVAVSFRDDAGHMWPGATVVADSFANVALAPGAAVMHSAPWDHRACATPGCGPLPAGPYYATFTWTFGTYTYEVLQSFILR